MNKYLHFVILFFTPCLAFPGVFTLTAHSRANCINNELITYILKQMFVTVLFMRGGYDQIKKSISLCVGFVVISSYAETVPVQGIKVIPDSRTQRGSIMNFESSDNQYIYVENFSEAYELTKLKKMKLDESIFFPQSVNPRDTHMRKELSKIHIAFPFAGIPLSNKEILIGFAPAITNTKQGWTGISEFFDSEVFGVCRYELYNLELSHGGMVLSETNISYAINGRPTKSIVKGNPSDGFLYRVSWYDDKYVQKLSCAKNSFDSGLLQNMMSFAKKIDNSIER